MSGPAGTSSTVVRVLVFLQPSRSDLPPAGFRIVAGEDLKADISSIAHLEMVDDQGHVIATTGLTPGFLSIRTGDILAETDLFKPRPVPGSWCNAPALLCYRRSGQRAIMTDGACANCGLLKATIDAVANHWEPLENDH